MRKRAGKCPTSTTDCWSRGAYPSDYLTGLCGTETVAAACHSRLSVGGTLTGRGGNILILDDLLKPEDAFSETKRSAVNQWFDGTLYSRLDDKRTGVIILIMQRLHLEDLAGHVLQQEHWEHLDLPAIAEVDQEIPIGPNETHSRKVGELLHAA